MAKQANTTGVAVVADNAARKASTKPSKGTSTKPATQAPAGPLAALAATLAATPAPVAAKPAVQATVRGLPTHVSVRAGATYRTKAEHCVARWAAVVAACAAGGGKASTAALMAPCTAGAQAHNYTGPGVPAHFITYCVRRGYLAGA